MEWEGGWPIACFLSTKKREGWPRPRWRRRVRHLEIGSALVAKLSRGTGRVGWLAAGFHGQMEGTWAWLKVDCVGWMEL
jgi:hypothetical protein